LKQFPSLCKSFTNCFIKSNEEEVVGLSVCQPNFPVQCFWHLVLGRLCLATASVSSVDSRLSCPIHIKSMGTLYNEVVDPATCKGLLSHHKLVNHAFIFTLFKSISTFLCVSFK
jgi:hypothetical protein